MNPFDSQAELQGPRWTRIGGEVLVATFVSVAWVQWRQFELLGRAVGKSDDNVVWRFFQLATESLLLRGALRERLNAPGVADLAPLRQRYEIFVSRFDLIEPDRIHAVLQTSAEHPIASMAPQARTKGLTPAATLQPGTPRWVRGDATRLRQILPDLLSHGIKAGNLPRPGPADAG
jgi:hypothetical protein